LCIVFITLEAIFYPQIKSNNNVNKIIIDKREAKDNIREARETKVKARRTRVDAKANAKATTTTTTTTTINRKQLSKLRKQFVCTHVNLVFKIMLILLGCLLLFNNLQECANNALYN